MVLSSMESGGSSIDWSCWVVVLVRSWELVIPHKIISPLIFFDIVWNKLGFNSFFLDLSPMFQALINDKAPVR